MNDHSLTQNEVQHERQFTDEDIEERRSDLVYVAEEISNAATALIVAAEDCDTDLDWFEVDKCLGAFGGLLSGAEDALAALNEAIEDRDWEQNAARMRRVAALLAAEKAKEAAA